MGTVSGLASWFGGPRDSSSGPTTASGAPVSVPGIAIYDHATLGHCFHVTAPNGRSAILKQTDIGPAPWTGRKIDVTYSALGLLGYSEGNFPTSSGQFHAVDLGSNCAGAGSSTGGTAPVSGSASGQTLTPAQASALGCGPTLAALCLVAWAGAALVSRLVS